MSDSEMYLHDVREQDIEVVTDIKVGEAWFDGDDAHTVVIFESNSLQEMITWGLEHEGVDSDLAEFQAQARKTSRVFTMTKEAEKDLMATLITRALNNPDTRISMAKMMIKALTYAKKLHEEET